jgi:hypothetical protein
MSPDSIKVNPASSGETRKGSAVRMYVSEKPQGGFVLKPRVERRSVPLYPGYGIRLNLP